MIPGSFPEFPKSKSNLSKGPPPKPDIGDTSWMSAFDSQIDESPDFNQNNFSISRQFSCMPLSNQMETLPNAGLSLSKNSKPIQKQKAKEQPKLSRSASFVKSKISVMPKFQRTQSVMTPG